MSSEILVIGSGIIGLAIAVELQLRGAQVTLVGRDFDSAAANAAAGMLAPGAEQIPAGSMQDLCKRSLYLYPEWTQKIEKSTGENTGYWSCGIVAPVFEKVEDRQQNTKSVETYHGKSIETLHTKSVETYQRLNADAAGSGTSLQKLGVGDRSDSSGYWLDKEVIHQYQPGLGKEVIGGWWYPEDGQVDNRALVKALLNYSGSLGIEIKQGIIVEAIQQRQGKVIGVQTNIGTLCAEHYVLAAGAWSNQLFPLPVRPRKGQMLSLRMPEFIAELPLTRVLFGEDIYVVPRRDRRIIIGATNEDVGFTNGNTPIGIQNLLQQAIRLYPQLQDYLIQELWWGFRPTTPDELPILGSSTCDNLTLATGHHRNGILLAPITAKLIADFIWEEKSDPILADFNFSRFLERSSTNTSMLTHPANFSPNFPAITNQNAQITTDSQILKNLEDSPLNIAGKNFQSRLMTGTGKYRSIEEMQQSVIASGCEIVTVAVRRVQSNAPGHEGLAEALDWGKIWMLPNTAGCKTAEEAVRVARLGREMAKLLGQEDNNFVKLEVIPDSKYLLPDPIGTLEAAEKLVKEGFAVLPYINADPMLAKRLEEVGCATVMPLAAPIGSGQGLQTTANIKIIIENAQIPVVVDAGIGSPSEAAQAMELGADVLLINSAIALAKNSPAMARAMNLAATAGRIAYLAGRMPIKTYASASSPLSGKIGE